MASHDSTCWTVVRAAANGSAEDREEFARRYTPVIRAYLAARWRASPCLGQLDDAIQDVFLECFKPEGVLQRADPQRGLRPFLYGAVRNVALRVEEAHGRRRQQQLQDAIDLDALPNADESLSRVFDRAWARTLVREASDRMAEKARTAGDAAQRRVELLRLRFQEGLPIRDIAALWTADPAHLHHEYATARQEFKAALREVVAFHHSGTATTLDEECANLISLLH